MAAQDITVLPWCSYPTTGSSTKDCNAAGHLVLSPQLLDRFVVFQLGIKTQTLWVINGNDWKVLRLFINKSVLFSGNLQCSYESPCGLNEHKNALWT